MIETFGHAKHSNREKDGQQIKANILNLLRAFSLVCIQDITPLKDIQDLTVDANMMAIVSLGKCTKTRKETTNQLTH